MGDAHLPPNPWWLRNTHVLVVSARVVSAVAAIVEVGRVLVLDGGPIPLLAVVLVLLGCLVVSRWRWVGLGLGLVGCAVASLVGWHPITDWTIVVFTLFIATFQGIPPLRAVGVVGIVLWGVVAVEAGEGLSSADALAAVAASIAGGAVGAGLRSQARYWTALRDRAEQAVATRAAEARRQVELERLRIARDLHDVVGHQVAVASMHLGAVEVTIRSRPDAAVASAGHAREALRNVTTETQQILTLLRTQDPDPRPDQPVAGLASIGLLVESFEQIGLRVDVDLDDSMMAHPSAEMTAYRIVQEALTNAHRYGLGAATLRVRPDGSALDVLVRNEVRSTADPGSGGFGLIGMRERVEAAGGSLSVHRDQATFTVHAVLPTGGSARS